MEDGDITWDPEKLDLLPLAAVKSDQRLDEYEREKLAIAMAERWLAWAGRTWNPGNSCPLCGESYGE